MGDFANLFVGHLSRKQIRSYIEKLVKNGMLAYIGEGKMRTYSLSKRYESEIALITKAVEIGLNEISRQVKDQNLTDYRKRITFKVVHIIPQFQMQVGCVLYLHTSLSFDSYGPNT